MRRLFGWIAGLVGIAALARHARPPAPGCDPTAGSRDAAGRRPAEALRRKLDEARAPERASAPTRAAAPADRGVEDEAPRETLEERRARVHAKAQGAIDAMQEPPA